MIKIDISGRFNPHNRPLYPDFAMNIYIRTSNVHNGFIGLLLPIRDVNRCPMGRRGVRLFRVKHISRVAV